MNNTSMELKKFTKFLSENSNFNLSESFFKAGEIINLKNVIKNYFSENEVFKTDVAADFASTKYVLDLSSKTILEGHQIDNLQLDYLLDNVQKNILHESVADNNLWEDCLKLNKIFGNNQKSDVQLESVIKDISDWWNCDIEQLNEKYEILTSFLNENENVSTTSAIATATVKSILNTKEQFMENYNTKEAKLFAIKEQIDNLNILKNIFENESILIKLNERTNILEQKLTKLQEKEDKFPEQFKKGKKDDDKEEKEEKGKKDDDKEEKDGDEKKSNGKEDMKDKMSKLRAKKGDGKKDEDKEEKEIEEKKK